MSTRVALHFLFFAMAFEACSKPTVDHKPSVEQLREEQDRRLKTEARSAVVEDYKKRREADPKDPTSTYLYGRLLEESAELVAYADEMVRSFPKFSWSHFLRCSGLWGYGRVTEAQESCQLATQLEPASPVVTKRATELESGLLQGDATEGARISEALGGDVALALQVDDLLANNSFDGAVRVLGGRSFGQGAVEAVGYHSPRLVLHAMRNTSWVLMFLRNSGDKPLRFDGADIKNGWVVACFTKKGERVLAKANSYPKIFGEQSCRTCPNTDFEVLPGQTKRLSAMFDVGIEAIDNCVFRNVPRPGQAVLLRIPPPAP